jgi:predicted RNase H-like HicB family nuclease
MRNNLPLSHNINAFVRNGEQYYVAECVEIGVVTQGKTVDETIANLKEAVALHLDNENLSDFGLAPNPSLIITMEVEPIASAV